MYRKTFKRTFVLLLSHVSLAFAQTSDVKIATLGQENVVLNAPVTNAICASGGTKIIFTSSASNAINSDSNGKADVFLRDTDTGVVSLVSGDQAGTVGDDASGDLLVYNTLSSSPDGRYVAFSSRASNLTDTILTSGLAHILVRDMNSVTNTLVSKDFSGEPATSGDSYESSISEDGTKIAFSSSATNLVTGDENLIDDIFLRNLTAQSTSRLSVASDGSERTFSSLSPRISGDGAFVLFGSFSALVPDKTSTTFDFFVRDLASGSIERINSTTSGGPPQTSAAKASISRDGRYVAFSSFSSEHIPGDTNAVLDVFLYDRQERSMRMVSTTGSGQMINDAANGTNIVEISPDGRYVLFDSTSRQLVKNGKTDGTSALFLKDTVTGGIGLVDVLPSGQKSAASTIKAAFCNTSPLKVIFQSSDPLLTPTLSVAGSNYFLAEVIPPEPPPFEKGTVITAPPNVDVDNRTVTLTLASFSGVQTGKSKKVTKLTVPLAKAYAEIYARAAKPRLNYVVTLISPKGGRRDIRTKNSARNVVTFRNLPPGSYTAKYTVQATQKGKILFKTKASPSATFTVSN